MPPWLRAAVLRDSLNPRNSRPAFHSEHGGVWHCEHVDFYRDGSVYPTFGVEPIPWSEVDSRSRAEVMLACVCPD